MNYIALLPNSLFWKVQTTVCNGAFGHLSETDTIYLNCNNYIYKKRFSNHMLCLLSNMLLLLDILVTRIVSLLQYTFVCCLAHVLLTNASSTKPDQVFTKILNPTLL